jgi:RimJ/RimL family protein N-acetyltransferase
MVLRPIEEADLPLLRRFEVDADMPGEFEWFGFRPARANDIERRWREDGLIGGGESLLAVALDDGTCAGLVNWKAQTHGNWEIGIALFREYRGRGLGTQAQRLLVRYLFEHTTAHRIQAGTEVDNLAEQRALEKTGFRREGVMRGVHFRAGRWRDGVMYGLTRDDLVGPDKEA